MASTQSKLEILINARNMSSPAINQLKGDLADLDKSAANLAKGLSGLATGLGVAGLVALGGAAAGASIELGRLGAQAIDIEVAMDSLAAQSGSSARDMLNGLKEASRGAISDYDLMLTANRAMLLGVADNTEEMVALMDVARARSQALGLTTAEAFSDIVTGIGRLSPEILDNLGVVVDQAKANEEYAASIGKAVEKLTEQEQKQALVNAVLKDSAALVAANEAAGDDMASKFERMDAAIANAKSALGELFSPAVAVIAEKIANATEMAVGALNEMAHADAANTLWAKGRDITAAMEEMEAAAERMRQAGISGDVVGLREAANHIEMLRLAVKNMANEYNAAAAKTGAPLIDLNALEQGILAFDEASAGLRDLGAAGQAASGGLGQVGLSASAAEERLKQLAAQAAETQRIINGIHSQAQGTLESAAMQAVSVMGATEVARIFGPAKERLDAQIKALEKYGGDLDWVKFKSQELADAAALPFTAAVEAAREAEKSTNDYAKSLSDAEQLAEQAFNNIRSMADSVLRSALQHGTGVDPDDVLASLGIPRADAINENARRLADIAKNGLKDQDWLEEFANEVPDIWRMIRTAQNPQEEAAHLLRDFQDGLLTSPIDRDKAKEIIRRQLTGDRNLAEMAEEIAQELAAEMGVPLQEAMAGARSVLGVGAAQGGVGGEMAQSLADGAQLGMEDRNGGGQLVDTYVTQMRANFSKLATAGRDAGKQWGDSFISTVGENVPPALIRILTDLVTPSVVSQLAQQGTLTGPAQ